MKSKLQERILIALDRKVIDLEQIAKSLGNGITAERVASEICILTRRGEIDKVKGTLLLREYPNFVKMLSYSFGSKCKTGIKDGHLA